MSTFKTRDRVAEKWLDTTLIQTSAALSERWPGPDAPEQHSYDTGVPLEVVFRAEVAKLLPTDFHVGAGTVLDADGFSCGECDVVVYRPARHPPIAPRVSAEYRRKLFSNDAVYGIIEVGNMLTPDMHDAEGEPKPQPSGRLWEACRKIAAFKELRRDETLPEATPLPAELGKALSPCKPFGYVFYYGAHGDLWDREGERRILREMRAICRHIPKHLRPDGVYVLNRFSLEWADLHVAETQAWRRALWADALASLDSNSLASPKTLPSHATWRTPAETANSVALVESRSETFCRFFVRLWDHLVQMRLPEPRLGQRWSNCCGTGISAHFGTVDNEEGDPVHILADLYVK